MPEFIDPVFTKTSPKRSFSINRKRAFWLVFAKTGSIISGTGLIETTVHDPGPHLALYRIQKPVLLMDNTYLDYRSLCYIWTYLDYSPVLHLDVSRLQEPFLHVDLSRLQEPALH